MSDDDLIRAANVIVCVIGSATASGAVAGAGAGIATVAALTDFLRNLSGRTPSLQERIANDLKKALERKGHLPESARLLIAQMVQVAALTPEEVMGAARQPKEIVARMLGKMRDPAHCTPPVRQQFSDVMIPLLRSLLADNAQNDLLRPAFDDALALTLRQISEQIERLAVQLQETARSLGVAETLILELARRYAPGSEGDMKQAYIGLEKALQTAAEIQQAGPFLNTARQVNSALTRLIALNNTGEIDAAAETLMAARDLARDRMAAEASGYLSLLTSIVAQSRLRNRPEDAASALQERLALEPTSRDPFTAVRTLQREWYVLGRDKAINFDAEVAVHLARRSNAVARGSAQRRTALRDLGCALRTLGQRAGNDSRLKEAVAAFKASLSATRRDRAPLVWARTQSELGEVLTRLGDYDASTDRLHEAVKAFKQASIVLTKRKHRLQWAKLQLSLGIALTRIGVREAGTESLSKAVGSFRSAVDELSTRGSGYDRAVAHANLGIALKALGERERSVSRMEDAIAAFQRSLRKFRQNELPLQWAMAQKGLGDSLALAGELQSRTDLMKEAESAYRLSLRERTRERAPVHWASTQAALGVVLYRLALREGSLEHLHMAEAALGGALEVLRREAGMSRSLLNFG